MAGGTKSSKRKVVTPGAGERKSALPIEETQGETEAGAGRPAYEETEETLPEEEKDFNLPELGKFSAFTGEPLEIKKRARPRVRKRVTPITVVQPETPPAETVLTDQKQKDRWQISQEARELAKGEVEIMSITILSLLNGVAGMAFGDDAVMNKYERQMISEPLERIVSRMDNVTKGLLTKYADPFLLATGLVAWGSRIRRDQLQKQEQKDQEETEQVRKVTKPTNSRKPQEPERTGPKPFDYSQMSSNLDFGGVQ